jgi:hypothetical protein
MGVTSRLNYQHRTRPEQDETGYKIHGWSIKAMAIVA